MRRISRNLSLARWRGDPWLGYETGSSLVLVSNSGRPSVEFRLNKTTKKVFVNVVVLRVLGPSVGQTLIVGEGVMGVAVIPVRAVPILQLDIMRAETHSISTKRKMVLESFWQDIWAIHSKRRSKKEIGYNYRLHS